ncbi:MAG: ABC transporter permease [Bacteroidota bacterium]|nr:ABC transporter permease [Bacteroidota bacterium]MDX5428141.1 ABC transporter permease [Bacteroidota bacterium]MDX5449036.1 ABC transporter permease [Bacteroidota bacterium]MDX5505944.1 ABC transporter permease [Bacteroidota bacterium]
MRTLMILLRKEFRQIFRNKAMLPIIFVMPVVQLLILVHAADFEVRHIRVHVQDMDASVTSRQWLAHIQANDRFEVSAFSRSFGSGMNALDAGNADVFLRIPLDFEKELLTSGTSQVMVELNGMDAQFASLAYAYLQGTTQTLNGEILFHKLGTIPTPPISIHNRFWYNLTMNYKNLMVPGLLAVLVTLAGMFLSSMNIVREKEIGTIEQLNVTPIKKWQFIVGKLLPFWLISLFLLALGLTLGWLLFDIPIEGSLVLLFLFAGLYLIVMLGLGLLISSLTDTQQQAMFVSWFFLVIFILMSGLFTPIENMPEWARVITWFNPVSYFMEVIRMVLLKGSGLKDILHHAAVILLMGVIVNSIAIRAYRKTT